MATPNCSLPDTTAYLAMRSHLTNGEPGLWVTGLPRGFPPPLIARGRFPARRRHSPNGRVAFVATGKRKRVAPRASSRCFTPCNTTGSGDASVARSLAARTRHSRGSRHIGMREQLEVGSLLVHESPTGVLAQETVVRRFWESGLLNTGAFGDIFIADRAKRPESILFSCDVSDSSPQTWRIKPLRHLVQGP